MLSQNDKMICPYCQNADTKVTDKRDSEAITRRRRECLKCGKRFTTYEHFEMNVSVVKKDGKRERFDREKLKRGIFKSFEKLPTTTEEIEEAINLIESRIYRVSKDEEISTSKIGEIVMDRLKKLNKVAYIRFASVYREFADLDDFKEELKILAEKKK